MTIRRRVRVALFLMMLVPVFFMIAAFGFTRIYSSGTGRPDVRAFISQFNQLVNDNPHALTDPQTLATLDQLFGRDTFGWWEILRDGKAVYQSSGATMGAGSRQDQLQDRLQSTRPRWGLRWRDGLWGSRWFSGAVSRGAGSATATASPAPDLTWSFRFDDGTPGALRVYLEAPVTSSPRSPFRFIGFLAFLFGCNAMLGWWVSSSVIGPLAKLRNAAVRIGEGDLRFRLDSAGPDEFGQVTAAFETMREKLQAAVQRQLAEEASRKELIAHVSHDLRTPINLIRGYAEGLRDGVASTWQMRERYLETILERAGELERLIELLFSYSTMDLEGVRPKLASVEAAPYLQGLRDSLAAAFPAAEIALVLPTSPRLFITADVELTRRVISNLVENAVKHGGKPSIAMEWRVSESGDAVEVAVADNGAGVSAEDLPRIFDPFFRADRARTRQSGSTGGGSGGGAGGGPRSGSGGEPGGGTGAGLGLSIVSKIMQAQGGSVRAAPSAAGGLEVTLSFVKTGNNAETNPDH